MRRTKSRRAVMMWLCGLDGREERLVSEEQECLITTQGWVVKYCGVGEALELKARAASTEQPAAVT